MLLQRIVMSALLWSVVACSSRVDARIDIAPDAHTPRPTYRVHSELATRFVSVEQVEMGADDLRFTSMWHIVASPSSASPLTELAYGLVPADFTEAAPAAVLFPGQYRLTVGLATGNASIPFDVGSDGRVSSRGFKRGAPARITPVGADGAGAGTMASRCARLPFCCNGPAAQPCSLSR